MTNAKIQELGRNYTTLIMGTCECRVSVVNMSNLKIGFKGQATYGVLASLHDTTKSGSLWLFAVQFFLHNLLHLMHSKADNDLYNILLAATMLS